MICSFLVQPSSISVLIFLFFSFSGIDGSGFSSICDGGLFIFDPDSFSSSFSNSSFSRSKQSAFVPDC